MDKNLQFSYQSNIYQIQNQGKGYRLQGKTIEVLELMNGQRRVMFEGKTLEYKILKSRKKPLMADSKEINSVMDTVVAAFKEINA